MRRVRQGIEQATHECHRLIKYGPAHKRLEEEGRGASRWVRQRTLACSQLLLECALVRWTALRESSCKRCARTRSSHLRGKGGEGAAAAASAAPRRAIGTSETYGGIGW